MDSSVPPSEGRDVARRSQRTQRFSRLLRELNGFPSHSLCLPCIDSPYLGGRLEFIAKRKVPKTIPSTFWQWFKRAQETACQKQSLEIGRWLCQQRTYYASLRLVPGTYVKSRVWLCTCNLSSREMEARRSLGLGGRLVKLNRGASCQGSVRDSVSKDKVESNTGDSDFWPPRVHTQAHVSAHTCKYMYTPHTENLYLVIERVEDETYY